MGYYINPERGTKEDWLQDNLIISSNKPLPYKTEHNGREIVQVVLIDNGWMTALGIAYDENELMRFAYSDGRAKLFCYVPRTAVEPFVPEGVL